MIVLRSHVQNTSHWEANRMREKLPIVAVGQNVEERGPHDPSPQIRSKVGRLAAALGDLDGIIHQCLTKLLEGRLRDFLQRLRRGDQIPIGTRSDLENVHQGFDVMRNRLVEVIGQRLLLEDVGRILH
jgi:hypothetical protein